MRCKFLKKYNRVLAEDSCPVDFKTILGGKSYLKTLAERIDKAKVSRSARKSIKELKDIIEATEIDTVDDFKKFRIKFKEILKEISLGKHDKYELAEALSEVSFVTALLY